ncbi:MAG: hypothetical protein RKR03_09905 [Candidatus Competibacter sp.]|nr:hypothetical protein [Candidatus Competibacter sp.]
MIIISPEQFKEAFLSVVVNNEARLVELWRDNRYTDFMLRTLLPEVANQLKLKVYPRDYCLIDSIFYEEENARDFPDSIKANYIAIAFEHEHKIKGTEVEIHRLQIYSTPLKVLVSYPNKNDPAAILAQYSRIIKWADIFSDFSTLRKQLVIFGSLNKNRIKWDFYVYKDGGFLKI